MAVISFYRNLCVFCLPNTVAVLHFFLLIVISARKFQRKSTRHSHLIGKLYNKIMLVLYNKRVMLGIHSNACVLHIMMHPTENRNKVIKTKIASSISYLTQSKAFALPTPERFTETATSGIHISPF